MTPCHDLRLFAAGVPGIYPNIPAAVYHSGQGVSKGGLENLDLSGAHFRRPEEVKESVDMLVGTLAHAWLFEGAQELPSDVAICPNEADFRTKVWKDWKASNEAVGRTRIIKQEKWDSVRFMAEAVVKNPEAGRALAVSGFSEVSLLANYQVEEGREPILLRTRPDYLADSGTAVIDLKTCGYGMAERSAFGEHIARMRYHWSAFHYLNCANALGLNRRFYVFIAQEREAPYANTVHHIEVGSDWWDIAAGEVLPLYRRFMACREAGAWAGYDTDCAAAIMPSWMKKKTGRSDNPTIPY